MKEKKGEMMRFLRLKKEKGITLVALVITIIVLLILAGVSISMLTGENGILKKAGEASEKTDEAGRKEKADLDKMGELIDEMTSGTVTAEQVTDEHPGQLEEDGDEKVINSIEDLVFFAHNVTNGNTYEGQTVKLGLSLDFNSSKSYVEPYRTDYEKYGYNGELKTLLTSGEGFKGIGDQNNFFSGTFDGNNCNINNISMNKSGIAGLFVYVNRADIKNLTIGGNISSTNYRVGGIVGEVVNNDTVATNISNCTNKAKIISNNTSSNNQAGGIVGNTNGKLNINNCYNEGNITSYNHAGGIIARVDGNTEITNCNNSGNITSKGGQTCGGIAGAVRPNKMLQIEKCFNTGTVQDENAGSGQLGGILGEVSTDSESDIINCYNLGEVKGSWNTGGIVGSVYEGEIKIENSYNNGNIQSIGTGRCPSGIISYIYNGKATIKNCYNAGIIGNLNHGGGICGIIYGRSENSILNIDSCYNVGKVDKAIIRSNGGMYRM